MRKTFLCFLLFVNFCVFSQVKEVVFFPKNNPEILKDKEIKINAVRTEMYPNFFILNKNNEYKSTNAFDNYKKYLNKSFTVIDIVKDKYNVQYLALKLNGSKDVLYYRYNEKLQSEFPFSVLNFEIPTDFICNDITQSGSNYSSPSNEIIIYSKYGNKIILELKKYGESILIGKYDVVLFLSDNSTITFDNQKIDTKVENGKFSIQTLIMLTPENIEKLKTLDIESYLIGNESSRYVISDSKFRLYLNCLLNK